VNRTEYAYTKSFIGFFVPKLLTGLLDGFKKRTISRAEDPVLIVK
jgi:hypothetical protein